MTKEEYKDQMGKLISENTKLKDKVKELETELYFIYRNNKIENVMRDKDNESQLELF
tara:strand:+ start:625 stop:795 length:171 start_codon:yes stop_codon:yes gene_type:complete